METTTTPVTLRELGLELVELEAMLDAAYEQAELAKSATPEERAEFAAQRTAVEGAIWDYLVSNDAATADKVDRYCSMLREYDMRAKSRQAEAERLAALAKSDAGKVLSLKARLMDYMLLTGRDKLETPNHRVSICGNGGLQPLVINPEYVEHPERLPSEFQRVTITPDNEAIRKAIAAGEPIDFALLAERGKRLDIK